MEEHQPSPARGERIQRFVLIGALIGIAVFALKVAIFDDFDYGQNWLWAFAILAGAVGGGVIGLLLAGAGQHGD
jgi:hypothetical protein